mmetsp:Transcript_79559/g.245360  ORF Transcript_79559/g.245360 Transcript_79559/m.245360 type:complete len:362 (-) Transcript_79559:173-1258(-)
MVQEAAVKADHGLGAEGAEDVAYVVRGLGQMAETLAITPIHKEVRAAVASHAVIAKCDNGALRSQSLACFFSVAQHEADGGATGRRLGRAPHDGLVHLAPLVGPGNGGREHTLAMQVADLHAGRLRGASCRSYGKDAIAAVRHDQVVAERRAAELLAQPQLSVRCREPATLVLLAQPQLAVRCRRPATLVQGRHRPRGGSPATGRLRLSRREADAPQHQQHDRHEATRNSQHGHSKVGGRKRGCRSEKSHKAPPVPVEARQQDLRGFLKLRALEAVVDSWLSHRRLSIVGLLIVLLPPVFLHLDARLRRGILQYLHQLLHPAHLQEAPACPWDALAAAAGGLERGVRGWVLQQVRRRVERG